MNKEELINYVKNINPWGLRASEFQKKILEAVDQLDEPAHEPVEVPEVIKKDIDYIRNELECDNAEIIRVITFENIGGTYDDETTAWVNQHNDDVISAVLYGCKPMKKKWVVIKDNGHWKTYLKAYSASSDFGFVNHEFNWEKSGRLVFTGKAKAEAVATLVGGEVEEI